MNSAAVQFRDMLPTNAGGGPCSQDRIERARHPRHISSRNVVRRFVTIALQHISQARSPNSWTMVTECRRTCLVVTTPAIISRLLGIDLAAVVPDLEFTRRSRTSAKGSCAWAVIEPATCMERTSPMDRSPRVGMISDPVVESFVRSNRLRRCFAHCRISGQHRTKSVDSRAPGGRKPFQYGGATGMEGAVPPSRKVRWSASRCSTSLKTPILMRPL
jgi:hypothetical protein